jgi:predicted Zn-dependent protease
MVKKKTRNKNYYLWIVGIVMVVVLLVFSVLKQQKTQNYTMNQIATPTPQETKRYTSRSLNVAFDVPEGYTVEEKFATITIKNKDNTDSEINLFRMGTNYDNLESFLADLVEKNRSKITNKENIEINGLPAIKTDINDKRVYLIYKNNFVFSLETKSPKLYSNLDQIARSFKYNP